MGGGGRAGGSPGLDPPPKFLSDGYKYAINQAVRSRFENQLKSRFKNQNSMLACPYCLILFVC